MSTPRVEHEYTDEIVCPYCGYVYSDSGEFSPSAEYGEEECAECGRGFRWSRYVSVCYSTSKEDT